MNEYLSIVDLVQTRERLSEIRWPDKVNMYDNITSTFLITNRFSVSLAAQNSAHVKFWDSSEDRKLFFPPSIETVIEYVSR